MILYINVIITDNRNQGFKYNRYGLPHYSRYDIFKYSLASLSALNKHWSRVVMCCRLDHPYSGMWWQLEPYVRSIFKGIKVDIYKNRNILQRDWQKVYERNFAPVNDNLIWYHGNDDHIFVDYNLDVFSLARVHTLLCRQQGFPQWLLCDVQLLQPRRYSHIQ